MPITHLFIHRPAALEPETLSIRSRLNAPVTLVDEPAEVYRHVLEAADPVERAKQVLFLTRNRGAFLRDCPGTRFYTCCGYTILHVGTFCTMDCAYCILQTYFHPPVLTYFVNRPDMTAELDRLFAQKTTRRIGTGEFTDSMIWERWTDLSAFLTTRFSEQSLCVLELKTKTVAIQGQKGLDHNRKTIMAWSVNTPRVIAGQERETAPLDARLAAAARCASWGYPVAFHFDPMILYEGCDADYRDVVERIFARVPADQIVWISLGTFRFMPALKPVIERRFASSKIVYGEFVEGLDGKMRYFKPLRVDLYRRMVRWIRRLAPEVLVYFCMEDDTVWRQCMGYVPEDRGGLPHLLDVRARHCCGLDLPRDDPGKPGTGV